MVVLAHEYVEIYEFFLKGVSNFQTPPYMKKKSNQKVLGSL